jgi:hypothetical protein
MENNLTTEKNIANRMVPGLKTLAEKLMGKGLDEASK